jgi:hypothetical protein
MDTGAGRPQPVQLSDDCAPCPHAHTVVHNLGMVARTRVVFPPPAAGRLITMRFRTEVELNGKTATGVVVPDDVVTELGGKRPAVQVTINGYRYRSTVARMGGRYMLPISAEVRAGSGVSAGDVIDVELDPDTEPREVEVPADLAAALAGAGAEAAFSALSYTYRKEHVRSVESAKAAATRERRIAKVVADLTP